jgi:hypothetical protein
MMIPVVFGDFDLRLTHNPFTIHPASRAEGVGRVVHSLERFKPAVADQAIPGEGFVFVQWHRSFSSFLLEFQRFLSKS